MKRKVVRYISMAIAVAIMVIIFLFSAQNGEESGELSGWFTQVVKSFLTLLHLEDSADFVLPYIRKIAHFTLYACLGLSVSICTLTFSIRHMWLRIIIPLMICLIYACSDEIHQLFVEGREGKMTDVLIDFIGSATTILISHIVFFLVNLKRKKIVNSKD